MGVVASGVEPIKDATPHVVVLSSLLNGCLLLEQQVHLPCNFEQP